MLPHIWFYPSIANIQKQFLVYSQIQKQFLVYSQILKQARSTFNYFATPASVLFISRFKHLTRSINNFFRIQFNTTVKSHCHRRDYCSISWYSLACSFHFFTCVNKPAQNTSFQKRTNKIIALAWLHVVIQTTFICEVE